jgi:hypothetical protein
MANEVRQIVVSLPKRNGDNIKRLLREVATDESRSISNLVCLILTEWLEDKGYRIHEDPYEKSTPLDPQTDDDDGTQY